MRTRGARACRPARQPPAAGTLPAMHYFICGAGALAHAGRRGNPQPPAPSQPCTILYAEPGRPRMPAGAATPSRRHPPSHALFYMRNRGARACRPARQPPAAGTLPAMHYFICGAGALAHAGRRGNPQPPAPSQPCTILYAEPGRPHMPAGAATPSRWHPPSHALFICGTGAPAHAGRRGNPQPPAPSQPCIILYAEPGRPHMPAGAATPSRWHPPSHALFICGTGAPAHAGRRGNPQPQAPSQPCTILDADPGRPRMPAGAATPSRRHPPSHALFYIRSREIAKVGDIG